MNDERAVPWIAIAVPLDARSFDWEGTGTQGGGSSCRWLSKDPVRAFSMRRSSLIRHAGL